jgi:hypothetical protein
MHPLSLFCVRAGLCNHGARAKGGWGVRGHCWCADSKLVRVKCCPALQTEGDVRGAWASATVHRAVVHGTHVSCSLCFRERLTPPSRFVAHVASQTTVVDALPPIEGLRASGASGTASTGSGSTGSGSVHELPDDALRLLHYVLCVAPTRLRLSSLPDVTVRCVAWASVWRR